MKAILYDAFGIDPKIMDLPDPEAADHGVVLKVLATGMCRSDWHGWMGHDPDIRLPHVPGHEIAGRIIEMGSGVRRFKIGDRVTLPFVCGCGNCRECRSGNPQVCDHQSQPGFTHWGSFAEKVRIDHADTNLVHLPDHISDVAAAALGCRFITSFRAVVDQANLQQNERIAIHGCGGVGLSAIMIANAIGAEVVAVDIDERALELSESLGAKHLINAVKIKDVAREVRDLSGGGVDVSIDALGSRETAMNSIGCLKKRGRHIQVGLMTNDDACVEVPMDRIIAHELEIKGSHGMQAFRYAAVFEMIENYGLDPERFITKTVNLREAAKLLPTMNDWDQYGMVVVNSFS
ncbi:MAG: zinc-dependent alcohol dehydrogenase family protein [Flavobacteriaceae bacterium]|nr:zinc-dependent alcohol dehydrogenase family protein [Flavobacteriaceae bacterium]